MLASRRAVVRAGQIRDLYEILENRINGKVWSTHELMLGFTNDVGTVGRLILAGDGMWEVDGDVTAQLERKLAESVMSVTGGRLTAGPAGRRSAIAQISAE